MKKNIFLISLLAILAVCAITNVSTKVTETDKHIFTAVLKLDKPTPNLSFKEQIRIIKFVQKKILAVAPIGAAIPYGKPREPADLIKQASGLCYDRSRTLEKIYSWYGFTTRHVFILYKDTREKNKTTPNWTSIFNPHLQSHAITEVKTSKGWLAVDSNQEWIGLTRIGLPMALEKIYANQNQFFYRPAFEGPRDREHPSQEDRGGTGSRD